MYVSIALLWKEQAVSNQKTAGLTDILSSGLAS
jgi:hypothetical protein